MQFCEDIEKVIKDYTRPYRDPKSHKNHKRVMEQLKRISKAWRRYGWRNLVEPYFVNLIQHCFLPSF